MRRVDQQVESDSASTAPIDDVWVTLVWNDPVNLMSYVVFVFQSYFSMPRHEAEARMRAVHHDGRCVVSTGSRERMEVDVQAMHSYGLWATLQRGGQ